MRRRLRRCDDGADAQLRALLEPPFRLCGEPEPAGEPDLAEGGGALCDGDAARGGGNRERDRQVGSGLVDSDAARDVDENVRGAERDAGVA